MRQDKSFGDYPNKATEVFGVGSQPDDEISIDLRAIIQKLWHGKWIIVVSLLVAAISAFMLIPKLEPRYLARATVMFDLQGRSIANIEQIVAQATISENTLQNEVEILRSTNLIERVVDTLSLDENPEFNPRLRVEKKTVIGNIRDVLAIPPELLDFLRRVGILATPAPISPSQDNTEAERRLKLLVTNNVLRGLILSPISRSKVIQVSFISGNPNTSAAIVNTIAEQYIIDQLDAKLEATRAATDWLSRRVSDLRERVRLDEEAIETVRADMALTPGQGLKITEQRLQSVLAALSIARGETNSEKRTYDRLSVALTSDVNLAEIPEFGNSPVVQNFRAREAALLAELVDLQATTQENYPGVVRLRTQLAELQNNETMKGILVAEASKVVEDARIAWSDRVDSVTALESSVHALEAEVLKQTQAQVTIRQLERDAQSSRALYENFLGRLKETSQQEELQSADARILSPAQPPVYPLTQAKRRTMGIALVLGAMFGVGIIFLLDKLNNSFRSPSQLEAITGETVLGIVPAIGNRVGRRTVMENFRKKPKSSFAESIRNLRTSILFSNVDAPPKVIMFTSSVPKEGKTTTSMLMAMASHQMGKSAIIVDCDLRLPALADLLDADDGKPGLLSVVEGTGELEEAIFQDPETGLHVLMTKPSEPRSNVNAADILSSKRFENLIKKLKKTYDLVVLDTPPALVVADARILSSHADAVVYTIRWDHTPRGAVLEGLKELSSVNAPLAGVVLTLVNEARAEKFSYDGYSYYRSRYKDYYVT